MSSAAADHDAKKQPDYPTPADAAPEDIWDPAWIHSVDGRTRAIEDAMREQQRLFRLNVAALTLHLAELKVDRGHEAVGEVASILAAITRCCVLRNRFDSIVSAAMVTVGEALGVSRERLREAYQDLLQVESS